MAKVTPEIVAAITAAIQSVCGGTAKIVAVTVKRNDNWALASKINR